MKLAPWKEQVQEAGAGVGQLATGVGLLLRSSRPALHWDRGRPARREREARAGSCRLLTSALEDSNDSFCGNAYSRLRRSLRAGRPRSQ
jgi:hypothetical protein